MRACSASVRPAAPIRAGDRVSHQIVEAARCVVVTAAAPATGRRYARYLCGLIRDLPQLVDYDTIHNFMDFDEAPSNADVTEIAACYGERIPADGRTRISCIASPDPNYRLWAPALDHFFPQRRHLAVTTLEEAWAELRAIRAPASAEAWPGTIHGGAP
jgi:hypothetical protein